MLNGRRRQRLALVATQALCEGGAFLRNLILARLIGADEMGLAVALALAIRIFEMAGEFGLDRMLVQVEKGTLPLMRRMVHLLQITKGGLLAAAAILLAVPLSQALNPLMDPSMFALAALALAIRGASNWDFRERQRHGDHLPALSVEGGSALIATLACVPLAWSLQDYTALVWVLILQAGAFCALSHLVASTPIRFGLDRSLFSRCLRYGTPIALNGALMFLALQGDRVVVALHFPPAELARFALAVQFTLLPALIGARYMLATELPRFARLAREDTGFGCHYLALFQRVFVVSLAGAVLLGLIGNTLVGWLYGETYQVAPVVFWLLAVGAAIRLVRAVPGTALMALERTHFLFLSNLPRLVTLPVAFWSAASGGSLATIVAIAVLGEALSLVAALGGLAATGEMVSASGRPRLADQLR